MSDKREQFLLYRIRVFKDERAYKSIQEKHAGALYRFLNYKLPTPEDAEDAYNLTWWRVWNYLCSAEIESLSGLIFTIARGVVAEHYRKNRVETVSLDGSPTLERSIHDEGASSEEMRDSAELTLLKEAMEQLKERDQRLVSLRYFEGLSLREIARRMDLSEPSARVALHRALNRLRELTQHDGEGTDQITEVR